MTRTINYTGAGADTPKSVVQTVKFDGTSAYDQVTGKNIITWDNSKETMDNVITPDIKGYTFDRSQVDKTTVTPDSDDQIESVVYKAIPKIPVSKVVTRT
ncbi:mucin-binding protein, partial [Pediococcus argentinicus]